MVTCTRVTYIHTDSDTDTHVHVNKNNKKNYEENGETVVFRET